MSQTVDYTRYAHHPGRGETAMRSNPDAIARDLDTLDVRPGHRVLEIGTGSGYSGALLAALVGERGTVTSLDVDAFLVDWARLIHHEHGVRTVSCVTADGVAGHPPDAPYDRIVAWCTPPRLPAAWTDQLADDGLIVTPLPVAPVPHVTVVARIRVTGGVPTAEAIADGGYMPTTATPGDSDTPPRHVDWEYRRPDRTGWISTAWRDHDDPLHTHARRLLDRLLDHPHTPPTQPDRAPSGFDWSSWRSWIAAHHPDGLTVAARPR
ncbi:hypothetical protein GCM10022243_10170 [Saccharothrix violaceirubra]|uniref:Protein-L-isoaspartate O-methyltransferase n=1 Tax=Saccharothrix violaceirubra TaxID=413306 RepID=A0A7W7T407_9PSEU|nr:methyltransferase domain-containing protein [Saccharothrix violaceirubra]MBB4966144.1 protein-L-isoaspartate(D-aspartate) O-methyltransferase [Saccharothrix violaceirubra]